MIKNYKPNYCKREVSFNKRDIYFFFKIYLFMKKNYFIFFIYY